MLPNSTLRMIAQLLPGLLVEANPGDANWIEEVVGRPIRELVP
jgi:hypothetical protein